MIKGDYAFGDFIGVFRENMINKGQKIGVKNARFLPSFSAENTSV